MGQNYFFEAVIASGHVSDYFYPNGDPHGMERGVIPLAPVAPSTHHCGLMYDCMSFPTTNNMRSESVVVKKSEMKILQYNSWNSM